jgi:hypothetical protein
MILSRTAYQLLSLLLVYHNPLFFNGLLYFIPPSYQIVFISLTFGIDLGGRVTKAAKILEVQRSYLSRLIKELAID